jgi:tRNA U34 2-thiouridine synthase MnmA/TrmU
LIKFDVFLNRAMEQGFDYIATGHYARIKSSLKKLHPAPLLIGEGNRKAEGGVN